MTTTQTEDVRRRNLQGVLQDGEVLRAPLLLMDSAIQETADQVRKAFADADDGIMHKPGYVKTGISDAIAKTQQVLRDDRLDKMQDAWKNPPPLEIKKDAAVPLADVDVAAARRDQRIRDAWKGAA